MEDVLLKMKAEIEENKSKKARLEGELDGIKAQLKQEYGFDSIEEAEQELNKLQASLPELEIQLGKEIDALKSAYPWKTI